MTMSSLLSRLLSSVAKTSLIVVMLGVSLSLTAPVAQAGTDLTATCSSGGSCTLSPAGVPLFNESGLYPDETRSQNLTIVNNSPDSCTALVTVTKTVPTPTQSVNLADRLFASINSSGTNYFGVVSGGAATSNRTYEQLFNQSTVDMGSIAIGASRTYQWLATFDPTAGNEFQGKATQFDLNLNVTCGLPPSAPGPTSGGGGGGGGGSVSGSSVSAPVCSAQAPTAAPNLSISASSANTVTLNWNAVSPATHYAVFFTRVSDGATYGASNIGNVTSYTITNLSGGEQYTFQVLAVNDCAPGPRSGSVSSGTVAGGPVVGRPVGQDGQVLGTTTATPSAQLSATPSLAGSVEGASTAACGDWREYLPWILLVIQFVILLLSEFIMRPSLVLPKWLFTAVVTLITVIIFALLRQCNCYSGGWLAWLCQWFWLVSTIEAVLIRVLSEWLIVPRKKTVSVLAGQKTPQKISLD